MDLDPIGKEVQMRLSNYPKVQIEIDGVKYGGDLLGITNNPEGKETYVKWTMGPENELSVFGRFRRGKRHGMFVIVGPWLKDGSDFLYDVQKIWYRNGVRVSKIQFSRSKLGFLK